MRDVEHARRHIALFALIAVGSSLLLGGLAWMAPSPIRTYTFRDSLILVPVLSVIIAALGVGWRRKARDLTLTVAGFLIFDFSTLQLGIGRLASDPRAYGSDAGRTLLLLAAEVFMVVYPIVVLILFVGSRPSVLWTQVRRSTGTAETDAEGGSGSGVETLPPRVDT
jgi:hypothetical protein